jgi:hypothetical protein
VTTPLWNCTRAPRFDINITHSTSRPSVLYNLPVPSCPDPAMSHQYESTTTTTTTSDGRTQNFSEYTHGAGLFNNHGAGMPSNHAHESVNSNNNAHLGASSGREDNDAHLAPSTVRDGETLSAGSTARGDSTARMIDNNGALEKDFSSRSS